MMTAANLLSDLTRLGVQVVAHGDRLRFRPRSAVTPEIVEQLTTHKAKLLAILRAAEGRDGAIPTPAADPPEAEDVPEPAGGPVRWKDGIDPPGPCHKCEHIMLWWDSLGGEHCMVCNPPTEGIRLLEQAERIRRRHDIPNPAGTAEILAGLKRLAGTCILTKPQV